MKNLVIFLFGIAIPIFSFSQASTLGNGGAPGDYLGWNATTGIDLEIKHEASFPITFFTNDVERMRLTPSGNLLVGQTSVGIPARLDVLGRNTAIRALANSPSNNNYGGYFSAVGGASSWGAYGTATSNIIGTNYGLAGEACNGQTANYAVYGLACTGQAGPNWAGYFDGKTFCSSGDWDASDENLKTNIADLAGASNLRISLSPKSYEFDQSIATINLPVGLQYGILAQNLEEVIPFAVSEVIDSELGSEEIVANEFLVMRILL